MSEFFAHNQKPLVRWTIGDVHDLGFESLHVSIQIMKSLYGDKFDYVVCHNELNPEKMSLLGHMGVSLYEQKHECCNLPINPQKINAWKLFPPRLRIESHEIFVDNDLILHKKLEELDEFLCSSKAMILQGGRSSPAYGRLEHMIPKGLIACSALFGLPPNLDAQKEFIKMLEGLEGDFDTFDEQGMVSALFASTEGILIPKNKISNCWLGYEHGEYGVHFAGLNSGSKKPWRTYKMKMGMYI